MVAIRIALAQFESSVEVEKNREKLVAAVEEAGARGANLVAFHELATTSYFCYDDERTEHFDLAEAIPGPSTDVMVDAAKRTGVSIVLPMYERDGSARFNTVVYIEPDVGIVAKYRKTHVPITTPEDGQKGADEAFYFSAGDTGFAVCEVPTGVRAGSLICFDRHFPEGARAYALQGVHVIFVPTASYRGFIVKELWEAELQTMAFQNGVYVAGINKVGEVVGDGVPEGARYPGRSLLIDPEGRIVAQADDQEGLLVVDLDTALCDRSREGALRFLERRRPSMYSSIASS